MTEALQLKKILEGAILAAGKPLPIDRLETLFDENERPEREQLQAALDEIAQDCEERGFELKKVASGYRFQVRQELSGWIGRLWDEKPQRYSRALMETLSIIAYRQPITRGDIEKIRGVAVSTQIVQTLLEHEWVRVVGHRDVPGRPAMYATTKQFLDYFNLDSLEQLPPLSEIRDLEEINKGLSLEEDKPVGRILEFAEPEENAEDDIVDSEEAEAAAIGTRPISEILSIVDTQLGIAPEVDSDEEGENVNLFAKQADASLINTDHSQTADADEENGVGNAESVSTETTDSASATQMDTDAEVADYQSSDEELDAAIAAELAEQDDEALQNTLNESSAANSNIDESDSDESERK